MKWDQTTVKEESCVTTHVDVDGDDKPDISTVAAAEYIGSTESTMRTWRSLRKGPPYYRGLGKEILYRKVDLDAFIRSRRIVPGEKRRSA